MTAFFFNFLVKISSLLIFCLSSSFAEISVNKNDDKREMMEQQIEIYQSQDGIVLNVQLSNETVWLSQDQLAVLFDRDQSVISRHLSNVFNE